MKISEDVRKYAREKGIDDDDEVLYPRGWLKNQKNLSIQVLNFICLTRSDENLC